MTEIKENRYICQACKKLYKTSGGLLEHQRSKCSAYNWYKKYQESEQEVSRLKVYIENRQKEFDQILARANNYHAETQPKIEQLPQLTWERDYLKHQNLQMKEFFASKFPRQTLLQ